MTSPYANRPKRSFWKEGVSAQPVGQIADIYQKRYELTKEMRVATAGSCFAQHIATNLRNRGYNVLDLEPAPFGVSDEVAKRFGYNLYSARYGNIYTARQYLQLIQEALGLFTPQDAVWTRKGRFYDALRPSVEPEGLDSAREVFAHRRHHLKQVRRMLESADVMVFTFGLTEAWIHKPSGTVYPTAPETITGKFDPEIHVFQNLTAAETLEDFIAARRLIRSVNPEVKFLITVSPVPLNATATEDHVLVATTYSKSVLRAVAGQLTAQFEDVDYFPSYEIIATPFLGRTYFDEDRRSVAAEGVATVMQTFFAAHGADAATAEEVAAAPQKGRRAYKLAAAAARGRDPALKEKRGLRREKLAGLSDEEKRRLRREKLADLSDEERGARRERRLTAADRDKPALKGKSADDVVCEDALLEAFSRPV